MALKSGTRWRARAPRVAVIGVGSVGSMAMWRLAARGAEVVGFEQFALGHDRGAHGGESRAFRTAYFEDPAYVPLIRRAHLLWRKLEQSTDGAPLLTLSGLLMLGDTTSVEQSNVMEAIEQFGVQAEPIPLDKAIKRWPHHPWRDIDWVIFDREAGYMRPELAVWHAARQAEALGARLRTHAAVTSIDVEDDGVWVCTAGRREHFDHVVVTTGPWAVKLLDRLAPYLEVRRLLSAWFAATQPANFRPDRFSPFARMAAPRCYGLPAMDEGGLKLGLLGAANQVVNDPDRPDRSVQVEEVQAFRDVVKECLPGVHPDPRRVTAYMDAYTADGHGLVGLLADTTCVTVVVGLSGHGFKLAPVMGDIAADYSLTGESTQNLALLEPNRFATASRTNDEGS